MNTHSQILSDYLPFLIILFSFIPSSFSHTMKLINTHWGESDHGVRGKVGQFTSHGSNQYG